MIYCTVDPGITNFAICIEEFNHQCIKPFIKKRFGKYRTATDEFSSYLNDAIFKNGKLLYYKVINIAPAEGKYSENMMATRVRLTEFLESIREHLDRCDAFFSERQLARNPFAQQVEHHCYSYFTWLYGNTRVIYGINANDKYTYIGCKKKMSKYNRKKWASELGLHILKLRDDKHSLEHISKMKKKDDIGDAILLCQVAKLRFFSFQ